MKPFFTIVLLLSISSFAQEVEVDTQKHELFFTAYIQSFHFTRNSTTHESFNDKQDAYGLEYIYDDHFSISYNHFVNSRYNETDVYGLGYLLHFNEDFGLHLIGGYQEGYCFDGLLNSVECTPGKRNKSAFILPMLYYKHQYFKIDLFSNGDMIALRFNIKIYDLF